MTICSALQKTNGKPCYRTANYKTDANLIVCKVHLKFKIEDIEIITEYHKQRKIIKANLLDETLLTDHPGEIPIRNNEGIIVAFAQVSPEDYEEVMKYKWHKHNKYAKNSNDVLLHQFILGPSYDGNIIDHHTDHNGLNNKRENLRFTTPAGNAQNKAKKEGGSSKYLGVSWSTKAQKWVAKSAGIQLGSFLNEIEAAKKYDTYVMLKHGEFASTNKLVKFEDIQAIDIETLICKRTNLFPKNIRKSKKYYITTSYYKTQQFYACSTTLEAAEEKLKEFKEQIEAIKVKEKEEHLKLPITRNAEGKAILIVKNKKGEIIAEPVVDDDKWHELSLYTWCKSHDYYHAWINGKFIKLHRYLTDAKPGEIADHINYDNNNLANNTAANLRINDPSGNSHNKTKNINASSKYFGVSFVKNRLKWAAKVRKDKRYNLGRYDIEVKAAIAYNIKAKELYGDFANLNTISEDDHNNYYQEVYDKIKLL